MAFPAFLDTCAIYGAYLADTLLRLADADTYRPLWSAGVLEELRSALTRNGLAVSAVDYRIGQMQAAFPDAEVAGYEPLIQAMTCDEKDRHVLAAAVRANAEVVVTFNTTDFPMSATEPFDIAVIHPDEFLLDQLDLHPETTRQALNEQVGSHQRPPHSLADLLERLSASGVPRFAAQVVEHD